MTTAIWANIEFFPIEFHTTEILIALGNAIGKTVALDARKTSSANQVRLCVDMNLAKELPTSIQVNSCHYEVTFENTHLFSYSES